MLKSPLIKFFAIGLLIFSVFQWTQVGEPSADKLVSLSENQLNRLRNQQLDLRTFLPTKEVLELSVSAMLDLELLYQEGIKLGVHRQDPLIIDRLLKNMEFLSEGTKEETDLNALFDEAMALGMDQQDPIVRRRIVQLTKLHVQGLDRLGNPSKAQLKEYIEQNPAAFMQISRWGFRQIYFDPNKRQENLTQLLAETKIVLQDNASAEPHGDGSILPRSMPSANEAKIKLRFGDEFAKQVVALPANKWMGPIKSVHGFHFVKIESQQPARLPELTEVYNRAYIGWQNEQKKRSLRRYLEIIRDQYTVQVEGGDVVAAARFPKFWVENWM